MVMANNDLNKDGKVGMEELKKVLGAMLGAGAPPPATQPPAAK
jgi:hypothetical protein